MFITTGQTAPNRRARHMTTKVYEMTSLNIITGEITTYTEEVVIND
jgi:hypothetical protein